MQLARKMALCFNEFMRGIRLFVLVLLTLFGTDMVLAAPAGVVMQFAQQSGDMPCHQHPAASPDSDQTSHSQHSPAHGSCHGCMACVSMMSVGMPTLPATSVSGIPIPHAEAAYIPRIVVPSSRPPILS